jgi:hypothetical protein
VTKEYIGGAFVNKVLVTNVGSEGINGIKFLTVGPASTLGGGEEVGAESDDQEFVIETLLKNHGPHISQTDTTIAVRVEGFEGGILPDLYMRMTRSWVQDVVW